MASFFIIPERSSFSSASPVPGAGLSPAGAFGGDSDPSGGGETHHAEGQEPAAASVGPAGVRVRAAHPGGEPARDGAALQQLQRSVPEQLGRFPLLSRFARMKEKSFSLVALVDPMKVRLGLRGFTEQNGGVLPAPPRWPVPFVHS